MKLCPVLLYLKSLNTNINSQLYKYESAPLLHCSL